MTTVLRSLTLALAAAAVSPAALAQQLPAPAAAEEAGGASPFVPAGFAPPTLVDAQRFKLVPLGPALVKIDFDAYMSSIDHLQKTFTRSTAWPHPGITDADAMRDMETEQARFRARRSFAYAVLSPDGRRERGSVYVSPSPIPGYDAMVRLWVTKADHDAGFDAELYAWVTEWIRTDWPFARVAYPGRSIDWGTWDAAVAAEAAKRPRPGP
ncbi:twin-arginine translocation pathway signal protein [Sphingomonas sp. ABOLD]|jgi:hypothetical protein|uniref:Twin-arginine translocation pathway signal protein n=1 Tax=Sphingomonas trueperi TaxID=53317 RepID=A0A7X6BC50_9SPHN|nr:MULTISPECIES: twin-arginine translocation pathway signal protein [Sphingomonas]NJB96870.1 hypothetical protein [Sphingomonas trueperi]RSV44490.1 twin-arginine translocation pathway signal protein [Sphingomonas sp. ABOLE]RSV51858.1 twin-arginine translocation pathway signal protein [Sphingomonas sp. ABOLD]